MLVLADIFRQFTPFGPVHLAILVIIFAVSAWVIRHRRSLPEAKQSRFDLRLVWVGLALVVINQSSELLPWRFELNRSLPVHICDVVGLIAPLAILTKNRVLRAMLYYWGIGLSTQALITPELQEGIADFNFWVFWIPHGMIVVLALYDLVVFRYRPNWGDYAIALSTLAVFIALILPLNLWLGVNYAFVGRGMPGQASVIDFLGPWPLRVFKLAFAVVVFLAILTLPFAIARRRHGSADASPTQPAPVHQSLTRPDTDDASPELKP